MRLFVAIDLSPAAVDHVAAAIDPLRWAWPGVRWGDPDRWHLTLAFLGDVDDVRRERLLARLGSAVGRSPAPTLSLHGAGTFPPTPPGSGGAASTASASPCTSEAYQSAGYASDVKIGEAPAGSGSAGRSTARARPRVLWVGVAGTGTGLSALAAAVGAAARRSGIPVERRAYRPHVTLGRTRAPLDLTDLVAALATYAGPTWTVEAVHLFRSHLGPSPWHERLASWSLPWPKP
jgi:RNA 2',3'-cyclic 3'-phosphodiesterase